MPRYLTLEECSEQLGVDYKTIYRLVRSGDLPAGRVGRVYRVRSEDIDAYFEHQQKLVAKSARQPRPADRLCCSVCDSTFLSDLSIGGYCDQCGQSICQACWSVRKKRRCHDHAQLQNSVAEKGEEKGNANKKRFSGTALRATPGQTVERLKAAGEPALTSGEAVLTEGAFLRSFAQRIECIEELTDPLFGRSILLRKARVSHTIQPETSDGAIPCNVTSTFTLRTGGWGKPKTCIIIQASFASRIELLKQEGYDSTPLGDEELAPLLDGLAERANKKKCFHVTSIASPTGWQSKAVNRIVNRNSSRAFYSNYAAVVLVDLNKDETFFDETDKRLLPFLPLIAPAKHAAELERCIEIVKNILSERSSLKLADAARACKSHKTVVFNAFLQLAGDETYAVDELEGVGTVISRRNAENN